MSTVIFAMYAFGVLAALLAFGRWSDALGRRPLLLAGLAAAITSDVVFLSPRTPGPCSSAASCRACPPASSSAPRPPPWSRPHRRLAFAGGSVRDSSEHRRARPRPAHRGCPRRLAPVGRAPDLHRPSRAVARRRRVGVAGRRDGRRGARLPAAASSDSPCPATVTHDVHRRRDRGLRRIRGDGPVRRGLAAVRGPGAREPESARSRARSCSPVFGASVVAQIVLQRLLDDAGRQRRLRAPGRRHAASSSWACRPSRSP